MDGQPQRDPPDLQGKWRTLFLLALAELLGMSVWFSASAVVPALTRDWGLDESGRAWLTMAVQGGFVLGALASALFNLADRIPARWFFAAAAVLAAAATALIPALADGLAVALPLRFLTGCCLAGVYPVGMKIMTTWTRADRGLGIGLLVGALTIGNAMPHLLNVFGGAADWRPILYGAAALALLGGVIAAGYVREGPYRTAAPRFNWRYVGHILRDRPLALANLGYLGHMWELYAMISWLPIFLLAAFAARGVGARAASATAFVAIASGGGSSFAAGRLADRYGRTTVTIASLLVSGACAVLIGRFHAGPLVPLVALCLVWGLAVIADSAQFSACITELCRPEYTGTALTLQTSLGFLLTLVTIRLVPTFERLVGWEWAFAPLALGPAIGAGAMWLLRRSPEARRLAGGRG